MLESNDLVDKVKGEVKENLHSKKDDKEDA